MAGREKGFRAFLLPLLIGMTAASAQAASPGEVAPALVQSARSDLELRYFPSGAPLAFHPPLAVPAPAGKDPLDLRLSSPRLEDFEVYGEFPVEDWNTVAPEGDERLVEDLEPPDAEPVEPEMSDLGHTASGPIEFPAGLTGTTFHFGPGLSLSPLGLGADPAGRSYRLPGPALGVAPMAGPGPSYPIRGNLSLESRYQEETTEEPSTPAEGAESRVWSGVVFNF